MNPILQEHLDYLKLADVAAQFEPLATEATAKRWSLPAPV